MEKRQLGSPAGFEDLLPAMEERIGGQGLVEELCKGFRLLMDPKLGVITFESLRRGAAALGLAAAMSDAELREMVRQGNTNGDGALDQMEFCVLMFRLSPELMEESRRLLVGQAFHRTG